MPLLQMRILRPRETSMDLPSIICYTAGIRTGVHTLQTHVCFSHKRSDSHTCSEMLLLFRFSVWLSSQMVLVPQARAGLVGHPSLQDSPTGISSWVLPPSSLPLKARHSVLRSQFTFLKFFLPIRASVQSLHSCSPIHLISLFLFF